jgi:nicotinate-nucleotide adenylyltransferase
MANDRKPMRTGIFGGTFNPIHLAHLRIAEEVREACGLDRILFLPAALPPHKQLATCTPFPDRLAMVEAAVADHPQFSACDLEAQRSGASYSVDTLEVLQRLYPKDSLYFIIGLDSFFDISSWKDYPRLFKLANIVVAHRPEYDDDAPLRRLPIALADQFCYDERSFTYRHKCGNELIFVSETRLAISSTALREQVRNKRSIRYLVPTEVATYIQKHHLYLEKEDIA